MSFFVSIPGWLVALTLAPVLLIIWFGFLIGSTFTFVALAGRSRRWCHRNRYLGSASSLTYSTGDRLLRDGVTFVVTRVRNDGGYCNQHGGHVPDRFVFRGRPVVGV